MSRDNVEAIYGLSPLQEGMLFHSLLTPEAGLYVQQLSCRFQGHLDAAAFATAWRATLAHNPSLRTAFLWERLEKPVQVVHKQLEIAVAQQDWRGLPADEQERRFTDFLRAEQGGFDLRKAPLLRLALIQVADDAWRFVWSRHHILLDGWSTPLVFQDLFAAYGALLRGEEPRLPWRRPFRDYIAWLKGQDMARAEAFWRESLAGFTAPTPLGAERGDAAAPGDADSYAERTALLPEAVTAALQELTRRHRVTLNNLVQAAWALLLSRYSGEPDVVFGVTLSGRPPALPGVESMLGLFMNTLPLRARIPESGSLLDLAAELRNHQADLHQFEFTPLVQVQGWSDVPRDQPLFHSIVVFENY